MYFLMFVSSLPLTFVPLLFLIVQLPFIDNAPVSDLLTLTSKYLLFPSIFWYGAWVALSYTFHTCCSPLLITIPSEIAELSVYEICEPPWPSTLALSDTYFLSPMYASITALVIGLSFTSVLFSLTLYPIGFVILSSTLFGLLSLILASTRPSNDAVISRPVWGSTTLYETLSI